MNKKHLCLLAVVSLTFVATGYADTIKTNIKKDFSGTQGAANWTYEYITKKGDYKPMNFDKSKGAWIEPEGAWKHGAIYKATLLTGKDNDVALTWTSPKDGLLQFWPSQIKALGNTDDGVGVCIKINDKTVWPLETPFHTLKAKGDTIKPIKISQRIKAGDKVRFIVMRLGNHKGDNVWWNPYISFTPQEKK